MKLLSAGRNGPAVFVDESKTNFGRVRAQVSSPAFVVVVAVVVVVEAEEGLDNRLNAIPSIDLHMGYMGEGE